MLYPTELLRQATYLLYRFATQIARVLLHAGTCPIIIKAGAKRRCRISAGRHEHHPGQARRLQNGAKEQNVMEQMDKVKKNFGFGCMRLPMNGDQVDICLLYTSPSPRDGLLSRMPSSA